MSNFNSIDQLTAPAAIPERGGPLRPFSPNAVATVLDLAEVTVDQTNPEGKKLYLPAFANLIAEAQQGLPLTSFKM